MKTGKKLTIAMTAVLAVAGMVIAIYTRTTMTDKQKDPDYEDTLMVAQAGDYAFMAFERMRNELSDCPLILQVRPVEEIEYTYGYGRQLVHVEQVYQGEETMVDTDIYLASTRWYGETGGFVNYLWPEDTYLVFCSGILSEDQVIPWDENIKIVRVYDDMTVLPVFCYEDKEEVIGEMTQEETTYTLYKYVKNNEFFATSEEIFEGWREIKSELLSKYPK